MFIHSQELVNGVRKQKPIKYRGALGYLMDKLNNIQITFKLLYENICPHFVTLPYSTVFFL
jgi:hypothetical protein